MEGVSLDRALLNIHPEELEERFWACPASIAVADSVDALNFCKRLYSNVVALLPLQLLTDSRLIPHRVALNCLLLSLLHKVVERFLPTVYRSIRRVLSIHFRLFTLLATVAVALYSPRHPAYQYINLPPPSTNPPATTLPNTLQTLVLASAALPACAHALPATLPFRLELPIQISYLFVLTTLFAPPAVSLLSLPPFHPTTTRLYSLLATTPRSLLPNPSPTPHPPTPSPTIRAWLLVLTVQIFIGFTLPLYATYAYELHRKTTFLRDHLPPRAPPIPDHPDDPLAPPHTLRPPTPTHPPHTPDPLQRALHLLWAVAQNAFVLLLLGLLSWHAARLASSPLVALIQHLPHKLQRARAPWLAALSSELALFSSGAH